MTWTRYGRPNFKYSPVIYVEVVSETPKNVITSGPQDDIRHPKLHNTKKIYAVPTPTNIPVEVVPAPAMMTERGMGITKPIVNLSTALRRVVRFTNKPLYFPVLNVPLPMEGEAGRALEPLWTLCNISFSR